jgi:hypothetical protein
VTITPQLAEARRSLQRKRRELIPTCCSAPGDAYAAQLGLSFTLPDDLTAVYLGFGVDLPARNGEPSWALPMPARIVVDRGGSVRAAEADADYERRPEPQDHR